MSDIEQKIAELERKKDQAHNRIEALKAREREHERKRDARKKIVLGAAVIALSRDHEGFRTWLVQTLKPRIAVRDWPLVSEALTSSRRNHE